MSDVEIGRGKTGRRAYSLSEIGIVPARRTRDPEEVSIAWQIDAYRFELPLMACPMDSVVSPATAIQIGRLGGLAVLDLEGLWTRYSDPEPLLAEVTELDEQAATRRLQAMYAEPISEDLIGRRIEEIARAGVTTAASLSPQRTARYAKAVVDAGVDIFVIRGTTVSAEHVSGRAEPLNLKQFIYELDVPVVVGGCATYTAALHLMRTGAAGVLVGFGGGSGHTTVKVLGVAVPMATAIADVAAARRDYLDESGGRYVHVIADGSMTSSGDIAKALAIGADAVMVGSPLARATEAPGRGYHWGSEANHTELPRGARVRVGTIGTLEQILHGPSTVPDGSMNLMGALRRTMATAGYSDLKEFQRVEVVVADSGLPGGAAARLLRMAQPHPPGQHRLSSASCPASSPRPTRSTSATTSARCASGWRCRTATTPSTAWSTCTRSRCRRTRPCCPGGPGSPPLSCSGPGSTRTGARCSCRATCPSTPNWPGCSAA